MATNSAPRMLLYPLRIETLGSGLLLYLFGLLLFIVATISSGMGPLGLIAWVMGLGSALLLYVNLLFEYCLDILEASAKGAPPPVLRGSSTSGGPVSFVFGERRVLKQALMLAIFAGVGQQLTLAGFVLAGWAVWGFLLLALPAALIVNITHNSLVAMLNPVNLVYCARHCGWYYPCALLLLFPAAALAAVSLGTTLSSFLSLYPGFLYCIFLCLHVLGTGVQQHSDRFFTPIDFKADRKVLAETSERLSGINRLLSAAYEELRTGRADTALRAIVRHLDATSWETFDKVFDTVATWPFRDPGLHIARHELVRCLEQKRYMRALALAEWCVAHQPSFLLENIPALELLAVNAATTGQLSAVLSLLENLVAQQPAVAEQAGLRTLALDIAGNRLKDEGRHAALRQRVQAQRE